MKLNIQLFALIASDSKTVGSRYSSSNAYHYYAELIENSWDVNTNKSNITVNFKAYGVNNYSYSSLSTPYATISVDGEQKTRQNVTYINKGSSNERTICSWTGDVDHNQDGTKSISVTCNYSYGESTASYCSANCTITLSGNLTTIPRASSITSVSSGTTNYAPSVVFTPMSSTFKYKVQYSYGSWSYTSGFITPNSTNPYTYNSYTIADSTIAPYMTNSSSGTTTATLYTYDANGNQIGYTDSKTFTITLNSSIVPTVSIGTLTEANATMQSLNWGVFVQNKSQLGIPITANGVYSSTISSIITTINGLSFSGSNITTSTLVTAGNNTISTTATDSRGRTATATKTYTVVAYSNPQITTAVATRSLSDGTESDEGTYLKYSFVSSISPVSNHNAHTFRIGYKIAGSSTYTYTDIDTVNYSINKVDQVLNLDLSTSNTYDIIFEAVDSFMTSKINRQIDTGFDLMNFNASGKAMAIGKVSEAGANEELFEIDLPTEINSTLKSKKEVIVGSIRSKNIFDVNTCIGGGLNNTTGQVDAQNTVSITNANQETGTITFETSTEWKGVISNHIEVVAESDYILSLTSNNNTLLYIAFFYDSSKNFVSNLVLTPNVNFTIPSGVKYARLLLESTSGTSFPATITLSNVQLEEGTTATSYMPYQELDINNLKNQELVVGNIRSKNMCPNYYNNCAWGYADGIFYQGPYYTASAKIKVKPSTTYTISSYGTRHGETSTSETGAIFYDSSGNYITYERGYTITTPANCYYLAFDTNKTYDSELQLEEGSNVTNYMPFQELNNDIKIVLFSGSVNATDIPLNDSVDNYKYIEIIYGTNYDGVGQFVRKMKANTSRFVLELPELDASSSNYGFVIIYNKFHINSTKKIYRFDGGGRVYKYDSDTNWVQDHTNNIIISEVIGYK